MAIASSSLIDPFADVDHRHASGVSVVASRDEVWDARSYLVTAGSDAVLIDGNGNLGRSSPMRAPPARSSTRCC